MLAVLLVFACFMLHAGQQVSFNELSHIPVVDYECYYCIDCRVRRLLRYLDKYCTTTYELLQY